MVFGSPASSEALDALAFDSRLGLSATPERWKDEETESIYRYFGTVVYEFDLGRAIAYGFLVPYEYFPHFVELTEGEFGEYVEASKKLQRAFASNSQPSDSVDDPVVGSLLRQRALILNGASQKIPVLEALLTAAPHLHGTHSSIRLLN